MKIRKDLLTIIILIAVLIILPIFTHDNLRIMNILIMCLIWASVAASWDLIMGLAGIFTFGQVAFYVIGAYSSGIVTSSFGISPWLGILFGGIIAGVAGILVGLPCLNLKGAYIALVTFAVHMILEPLLKSNLGRAIGTGGAQGILDIPPLKLGNYTFNSFELVPWFYAALFFTATSLFIIYKIIHSTWGLAFIAVRESALFARSLGVNEYKYKIYVFGISAFMTGYMGAFYGHYTGMISTKILGLDMFLMLLVILVLGGIGRFPGAVIGAFVTAFFSELLRPLGIYRMLIFGAAIISLILFIPQGIGGLFLPTSDKYAFGSGKRLIRSK